MWWALLAVIAIVAIALLTGKAIHFGMGEDNEEDYIIGDDDTDWGDKS